MLIDGRKSVQRFSRTSGGNDVYVHKNGSNNYAVGVNGTSDHFNGLNKSEAEAKVYELKN